jgi:hypothetical protein
MSPRTKAAASAAAPADDRFDEQTLPAGAFAPAVTWHADIEPVIPGRLWTVRGATTISMTAFPATMTVVRDPASGDLALINALRFPDDVSDRIVALAGGRPGDARRIHVVRLGSYHGKYDSWWLARYPGRATLWALPGHKTQAGVRVDEVLSADHLPVPGAALFVFDLPRPEAVLLLPADRAAVFCDAVLNINSYEHCSLLFRPAFLLMGFRAATLVPDKLWTKWMVAMAGEDKLRSEYDRLFSAHAFDTFVSGHGPAEVGGADRKIRDALRAKFGR